jgi:uncharacterized protein with PQ loop repeat
MLIYNVVVALFVGLLFLTSLSKIIDSKHTQQLKFYLLMSTLAFLTCEIYKSVKYNRRRNT